MDKKTKDLIDDLIHFFEARNTGNATNEFLNRCKEAKTKQLPIPVVVQRFQKLLCRIGIHKKITYVNERDVNWFPMSCKITRCKRCYRIY